MSSVRIQGEQQYASTFLRYVELAKRFAPCGKWVEVGCGAGTLIRIARQNGIVHSQFPITPFPSEGTAHLG